MTAHGGYRPEIDGLRAVAVVPVVLYHAHVPGFSGGFVGVDIFFVISGFLITGILAGDIAAGRFSILTFYERRVRRIFPALFVMLAVASLLAVRLLLPFELKDFAASLAAAALFVSNLHFMGETGYFVAAAASKPLLHTWSLAVEEQYYIAFPVYLWLASRWAPRWRVPVTAAVLAGSLAWCIAMTHPQDDQAFFYTPTRIWELLAGSLLALAPVRRPPGAVAQVLALAGLAMIAWAVFGFDARTPFPGAAALLPVGGTVLVILACGGNQTWAGRLLSVGPMRFVGLISYSLYLWHWPLIVYWRFWRVAPPSAWETVLVVAASFAAAVLSWRYVEMPFRTRAVCARRGPLFAAGLAAMAVAVVAGVGVVRLDGLPDRVPAELRALADARFDEVDFSGCDSLPGGRPCVIGAGGADDARFAVWGDSHAGALMPAFQAAARDGGGHRALSRRGGLRAAPGRQPVPLGVPVLRGRKRRDPSDAGWAAGNRNGGAGEPLGVLRDGRALPAGGGAAGVHSRSGDAKRRRWRRTGGCSRAGSGGRSRRLAALGRKVVIVTQAPENEFELPLAMARARWLGREVDFAPDREEFIERNAFVDGLFRTAAAQGAAELVDLGASALPRAAMCGGAGGIAALPRQQPPAGGLRGGTGAGRGAGSGARSLRQVQRASQPPSTGRMVPWMYFAAGEARKTAAPAMSAASPQRPAGMRSRIARERSGSARRASVLLVSM